MSWFDAVGSQFGGVGDFLDDFGGFVHDAGSIADSISGLLNPNPSTGPLPGIVPIGLGSGTPVQGPPDPSSSNGLILLGVIGVVAFLVLRRS